MHEFRKLAQDVYAFLQPALVWYSSAGVIVGERYVIVVDSLTNAATTGKLLEEIRKLTDKPIRFLINTHSHADHVYTNHLFPEATAITTRWGREHTAANRKAQGRHTALFSKLFPEVDFAGGRYTLQEMTFSGSLSLYQGEREIRVLELGPGHSESDVVVHLPAEKIVFCGDIFMTDLPPLPSEGHVSLSIAHYRAIEALEAEIYVAGHGVPGTLAEVRAQRGVLDEVFRYSRECFEKGMNYDEALRGVDDVDFHKMIILSSYCEFTGQLPASQDPASQNHLTLLTGIAAEARRRLNP